MAEPSGLSENLFWCGSEVKEEMQINDFSMIISWHHQLAHMTIIVIGFADYSLFSQTWVSRNICIHKQTN